MPVLTLVPLGIGDAFSALNYSHSLAVGGDDHWLLIDCPHPIRKMMREAETTSGIGLDVDRIEAVVVTHLHADHVSGLEDFAYFNYFIVGRKTRVLAHPVVLERLWPETLQGGMGTNGRNHDGSPWKHGFDEYFDSTEMEVEGSTTIGPFRIECRPTRHTIPTFAVRVQAWGRTLGVSSDTAYDPELISWLSEADLIVHEATSLLESEIHTPHRHLAELPAHLRAKMRLIHLPDGFHPDPNLVEPLRQGDRYLV